MATLSRSLTRQRIVQMLYQWEMNEDLAEKIAQQYMNDDEHTKGMDKEWFYKRVHHIIKHHESLDKLIEKHSNKDQQHLGKLEQAVLRLGVFELLHDPSVPPKVAINEAIEVAQLFCQPENLGFINAILDQVAHEND